jgi:hypothetical protein
LKKLADQEHQAGLKNLSNLLRKESQLCEELRYFIATIKEDLSQLRMSEEIRAKEVELQSNLRSAQVRMCTALVFRFLA